MAIVISIHYSHVSMSNPNCVDQAHQKQKRMPSKAFARRAIPYAVVMAGISDFVVSAKYGFRLRFFKKSRTITLYWNIDPHGFSIVWIAGVAKR